MPVSYNTNCICFVIRLENVTNFELPKVLIFTSSPYINTDFVLGHEWQHHVCVSVFSFRRWIYLNLLYTI